MDEEHIRARLGKVTASRMRDVVARLKSGDYAASREAYMSELISERLTGIQFPSYQSQAMKEGTEKEPDAKAAYEFYNNATIEEVGFVPHPDIEMSGASPDGLIGKIGLVEFKCPLVHTHIATLRGSKIDRAYILQMQWQMACAGRHWCDWNSYCPHLPASMQLYTKRVMRDAEIILMLAEETIRFLSELDAAVEKLLELYPMPKEVAA